MLNGELDFDWRQAEFMIAWDDGEQGAYERGGWSVNDIKHVLLILEHRNTGHGEVVVPAEMWVTMRYKGTRCIHIQCREDAKMRLMNDIQGNRHKFEVTVTHSYV